eukprot:4351624-Pyramimonas_sp.AAC.1
MASQTSDVVIFPQRQPPEVSTRSPGPAFHPESLLDGPEARRGPPEAENSDKPPIVIFLTTRR